MQPLQDNELHPPENLRANQSPESLSQDEEQQALCSNTDQHHIPDDDEQEEHHPDPPQDQPEVQEVNQGPAGDKEAGVQDLQQIEDSVDRALPQHSDSDLDSNLTTGTTDEDEAGKSGGSVPSWVVTETEQPRRAAASDPVTPVKEAAPQKPERPSDPATPAAVSASSPNSSSDGRDMTCCDLLSLRCDSVSLASESNVFKRNEEDDTRSITTSSIMSLFHRIPLDPLEKEWLKSSAVGNMAVQRRLLAQEPGLVLKKDFVTGFTALHWAAKQGRQEAVDMMLRSGADVNIRSHGGYTALHLASIHGHRDVVQTLINAYNAKTNVRDYHGKTASQYWSGSADVFNKPDSQSGGRCVRRRRTQRYALPSLLLSRSHSQGQLNLDFRTLRQSASHDALDLHV